MKILIIGNIGSGKTTLGKKIQEITSYKFIEIDYRNLILKHNCIDFFRRRHKNKAFCKHICKFFLEIKEQKGEEFAQEKLYQIYKNLIYWDFIFNDK